jgi:hypothetical protein
LVADEYLIAIYSLAETADKQQQEPCDFAYAKQDY